MSNIRCFIDTIGPEGRFVQRVEGWAYDQEEKPIIFRAVSDSGEILEVEAHSKERPDVFKNIQDKKVPLNVGFICTISGFDQFYEKGYKSVELQIGFEEYETIHIFDVKKIYEDTVLFYCLDKVKIREKKLFVSGWMFNLLGEEEFVLLDENGKSLACEVKKRARVDVNEIYGFDKDKKTGFEFTVDCRDIKTDKVYFQISGGDILRREEIDAATLIHDNKKLTKLLRTFGPGNYKKNKEYVKEYGWEEFKRKARKDTDCSDRTEYELWWEAHRVNKKTLSKQRKYVFAYNPKISIVIPAYNTPINFLKELIDSFIAQSYTNWQLCFADGSTTGDVEACIKRDYAKESRIVYKRLEKNAGISENTNEAIKIADGDFIMFSDHDDYLEADALFEIVKALNEDRNTDVVYTDEDKVTMDSKTYYDPHFKPDFNPFLLCSNNYITHIFVVSRKILDEVGMLRSECDGAQDYDFILRCCEKAKRIAHVPRILYHWRNHPASTAGNPESKMYAYEAGVRSVQSHYDRLGILADVSMRKKYIGHYETKFKLDESKKAAIIVASTESVEMNIRCLTSIRKNTLYKNYEILFCAEKDEIEELKKVIVDPEHKIQFVEIAENNGFSAACNEAVKQTECDYVILMDNIQRILTPGWMGDMLGYCALPKIGAVGVRMLKDGGKVNHAGIVLGLGMDKVGANLLYDWPVEYLSYQLQGETVQNVSAASIECMMVKKEAYEAVSGLDTELTGIYRSIDFSMKLKKAGYAVIYDPKVEAEVFGGDDPAPLLGKAEKEKDQKMAAEIRKRWGEIIDRGDPYYNPNLSKIKTDFSLGY